MGKGARILVVACCCLWSAAHAQTVPDFIPEQREAEQPEPSAAGTVFLAIEQDILAGRLESARAALDQLLAADPGSFQALFLMAEIERRSGNLDAAIAIYRQILDANPELDRVRLELAVTLIAAGRDSDAEDELFLVLKNVPPGVVSSRIRNVLGGIEQRRTFVWDAGLSVVGDTNANAAPPDRVVTIFGSPSCFRRKANNSRASGSALRSGANGGQSSRPI
jgi:tetratricopeptide (TPR) repeat protein